MFDKFERIYKGLGRPHQAHRSRHRYLGHAHPVIDIVDETLAHLEQVASHNDLLVPQDEFRERLYVEMTTQNLLRMNCPKMTL